MKVAAIALLAVASASAQSTSVTDAYQRGVALGNQQAAIVVECLKNPNCLVALQAAQAQKDQAKAEKARLKAEAQARKEAAKAEKERQKSEIKLAKLRLQTEREAARRPSAVANQPAAKSDQ
jgi:hypothetical protein